MGIYQIIMVHIQIRIQLVAETVNQDFLVTMASKKIARLVPIVMRAGCVAHIHAPQDIIAKEAHSMIPYLVPKTCFLKLVGSNAKVVLLDSSVMVA